MLLFLDYKASANMEQVKLREHAYQGGWSTRTGHRVVRV